ncbi:response regulator transcription factor [Sphingomicrobium clamense]|uniref:Response regulator transcription factor n=1 Tax=Sphingomicrobium clamense TaxID=2851013 RepID=A0ABS6V7X8_9SPHN|nr:response regulator transcription factor [Sphingomicrobium sp. B8]MBW0145686.1 response regulator transcription factor [Sphingomicrobium sp. B8]
MARIIIADDDELHIGLVRAALEPDGHLLGALPDGSQVVDVLQKKDPDLLIIDCAMPKKSGIVALREIRSIIGKSLPVLVLTARKSVSDERLAFSAGADDYLRKPFHPEELAFRVNELLKAAKHRKSA